MAEVVTGFTLLCTPRAALGCCWAQRCVPALSGHGFGIPSGPFGDPGQPAELAGFRRAGGNPGYLGPGGRGFLSRDPPELGTCAGTPSPGWGERGGSFGVPGVRGVFNRTRRCCIPGRVCLKSLPPPSLPGEELLPLNWRMLQAPADEPEESCGKVKASGEAACSVLAVTAAAAVTSRTVSGLAGGSCGVCGGQRGFPRRRGLTFSEPGRCWGCCCRCCCCTAWAGRGHPGLGGHRSPPCLGPARLEEEEEEWGASLCAWGGRSRLLRGPGGERSALPARVPLHRDPGEPRCPRPRKVGTPRACGMGWEGKPNSWAPRHRILDSNGGKCWPPWPAAPGP